MEVGSKLQLHYCHHMLGLFWISQIYHLFGRACHLEILRFFHELWKDMSFV